MDGNPYSLYGISRQSDGKMYCGLLNKGAVHRILLKKRRKRSLIVHSLPLRSICIKVILKNNIIDFGSLIRPSTKQEELS